MVNDARSLFMNVNNVFLQKLGALKCYENELRHNSMSHEKG